MRWLNFLTIMAYSGHIPSAQILTGHSRLGCSWQGWPISWLLPWSTLNTSWMSTRFMWLQTTSLIPWRGNRWIEELWSWLSWLPENQANDAMPRNTDQDQCTAVMSLPAAKKPRIFELLHYVMPLRGQWQFSEKKGTEGITCLRLGHRHSGFETQRRQWKMQFVSSTTLRESSIPISPTNSWEPCQEHVWIVRLRSLQRAVSVIHKWFHGEQMLRLRGPCA